MTSLVIEHEGPRSMVVSSPMLHSAEYIVLYFQGRWTVPDEWRNVIEGEEVVKPNPFRRGDGKWVWLLRKDDA